MISMLRNRVAAGLLGVVGFLVCLTAARAEEPKPAKPAGGRVGLMLMMFGCENAVFEAAGIAGHETKSGPSIGTWHDIKGDKGLDKKQMEPLKQGEYDTLLLATPHAFPNEETWAGHVGLDSTPGASLRPGRDEQSHVSPRLAVVVLAPVRAP